MPKTKKSIKKPVIDDFAPERGKRHHQKLKPYLVLDYLMQNTDEQNPATIDEIIGYLDDLGISAERSSIRNDIDEINYVLYMLEEDCSIQVAVEDLDSGDYDEDKFIQPTANRRGYYVSKRRYDITETDARLLAETVYTASFLDEKSANRLVDIVCTLVSSNNAFKIKHDIPLIDRPRTTNKTVYNNVTMISDAMTAHPPKKISFKYQKYNIDNVEKKIDRKNGATYTVSPYRLLINNGNYYLLAFNDEVQALRTYRVDRMKSIQCLNELRNGEDEFEAVDLRNYTQRVFGMFGGKRVLVTLCFDLSLLDTVIDRFGTKGILYTKLDDEHFKVKLDVELSGQFYGWLLGLGNKVKIIEPDSVITTFTEYLDKVRMMY